MNNFEKNIEISRAEGNRVEKVNDIYLSALNEHPEYKKVSADKIKELIDSSLAEVEELENFADSKNMLASLSPEIAKKISAFWILSGPGTYDHSTMTPGFYDNDEYQWMRGMDRKRINQTVFFVRKMAEINSRSPVEKNSFNKLADNKDEIRSIGSKYYPAIIYNGSKEQNDVVKKAIQLPANFIPKDKIYVLGENSLNTAHQIKDFSLPQELHKAGKEIALVSHAPHLMRAMHMINHFKTMPKDMNIRLFPIKTPEEKKEEYASMEIRGLLYYNFLAKDKAATSEPYPYIIQGKN